jgi:hypothetical protein
MKRCGRARVSNGRHNWNGFNGSPSSSISVSDWNKRPRICGNKTGVPLPSAKAGRARLLILDVEKLVELYDVENVPDVRINARQRNRTLLVADAQLR